MRGVQEEKGIVDQSFKNLVIDLDNPELEIQQAIDIDLLRTNPTLTLIKGYSSALSNSNREVAEN